MPYALPEKRREYQGAWLKKKAKPRESIKTDKFGELTFEQVVSGALSKTGGSAEEQYNQLAQIVSELKNSLYLNRMAIAEIAERACIIRHGHHSGFALSKTLREFARKSKINHNTLSRWIAIKNKVFIHLPKKDQNTFSLEAGDRAAVEMGKAKLVGPQAALSLYSKEKTLSKPERRLRRFFRDLKLVHYQSTKKDVFLIMNDSQREQARKMVGEILGAHAAYVRAQNARKK